MTLKSVNFFIYMGPFLRKQLRNMRSTFYRFATLNRKSSSKLNMHFSQIIGVGFDLTPHYYRLLAPFRSAHPESTAGMPGNQVENQRSYGTLIKCYV